MSQVIGKGIGAYATGRLTWPGLLVVAEVPAAWSGFSVCAFGLTPDLGAYNIEVRPDLTATQALRVDLNLAALSTTEDFVFTTLAVTADLHSTTSLLADMEGTPTLIPTPKRVCDDG